MMLHDITCYLTTRCFQILYVPSFFPVIFIYWSNIFTPTPFISFANGANSSLWVSSDYHLHCAVHHMPCTLYNQHIGWVDIGIRTTVRLGKVHFAAKVCKICLKTFLVHWPLPDRCTLLGPCSTYGSKIIFSQYRVYGYQKTQNFM
jgi:hypothetical protein